MKVTDDNFKVVKETVLYSQLRDGASFFIKGDDKIYIKKNRFIATIADRFGCDFVFVKKDGMVESSWAKQITKKELSDGLD